MTLTEYRISMHSQGIIYHVFFFISTFGLHEQNVETKTNAFLSRPPPRKSLFLFQTQYYVLSEKLDMFDTITLYLKFVRKACIQ